MGGHEDEAAVREREEGVEAPEDADEGKARDDEADDSSVYTSVYIIDTDVDVTKRRKINVESNQNKNKK